MAGFVLAIQPAKPPYTCDTTTMPATPTKRKTIEARKGVVPIDQSPDLSNDDTVGTGRGKVRGG